MVRILKGIQNVAIAIEKSSARISRTRAARLRSGPREVTSSILRPIAEAAARYGLRIEDVNQIVETAIGGNTIGTTVEGRERYPISVRYARDFRDDINQLKRVLVADADGRSGADLAPR